MAYGWISVVMMVTRMVMGMVMVVGTMNFYDNTNVWLWKLGAEDKPEGQYLAVTDWPQVHEVDPHTLTIKV